MVGSNPHKRSKSLLSCFIAETNSVINMFGQALFNERIGYCPSAQGDVLVGPGFTAPNIIYLPLVNYLHNIGHNATIENNGWFNFGNFERSLNRTLNEARDFRDKHGSIDYYIGHSMAGLEGIFLLPYFPEIKKVISIAPPINSGKPWNIIKLGEKLGIPVPEPMAIENVERIVNNAKRYADKIVTISTPNDWLCPPYVSSFPSEEATNIVVTEKDLINSGYSKDLEHLTHAGLPSSRYVREEIIKPLLFSGDLRKQIFMGQF